MTAIHILHVDDEPDIREVVELSLGLDPDFIVHSCGSGRDAVAMAAELAPDIILLDVMMPVLDGPATLAQLRQSPATADVPVVFMTARTQARETDRFRSLGAVGVIQKPFDPMTLAASLRTYVRPSYDPLEHLRAEFGRRVQRDAESISEHCRMLGAVGRSSDLLNQIRVIAHALSGASGIYGFTELSEAAADLEDAVLAEIRGDGPGADTDRLLDALLVEMQQCGGPAPLAARSLQRA
ncbi:MULTISPECIES: response regulator [unclassified Bradyrhizobium]|uniref:response regulator n=1 Tax=unclassified Bradyrhizobium TaxID=2631580 RepID=UPI0028F0C656|nr:MULTISPECIES: response regulator [unclassified Bradyrhizobium]